VGKLASGFHVAARGATHMNGKLFDDIRGAYHGIFGIPDYDAYLKHRQARHPGQPVLTRAEFAAKWIDHKYDGMSSRCC
jgi:uncharacterized short protein YbdD (DUF466 family)